MATASSAVGTYAFTLGSLGAGPNYTLVLATSSPYWHEEEGPSKWVLPLLLPLLTLEGAAADDPSAPRHGHPPT